MASKNGKLPLPVVDFTRVGRKWTMQFGDLISDADRIARIVGSIRPEGSSLEAIEQFEETYKSYHQKLKDVGRQQIEHIAQVVVSVPVGCLTEGAPDPDDLDWTDPDSYDWIRQDVMIAFMTGLQTGELAKAAAKN